MKRLPISPDCRQARLLRRFLHLGGFRAFLPIVDEAYVEAGIHRILAEARHAASSGRLQEAIAMLTPVKAHREVAPYLAELAEQFGTERAAEIKERLARADLGDPRAAILGTG